MQKIVSDKALRIIKAMRMADADNLGIQANKIYEVCGLNTRVVRAILASLINTKFIKSKRVKRNEHVYYYFTDLGLQTEFRVKKPQNMTAISNTILAFIESNGAVSAKDIEKEIGLSIESIELQLELLVKRNHIEQKGNLYEPKYE